MLTDDPHVAWEFVYLALALRIGAWLEYLMRAL